MLDINLIPVELRKKTGRESFLIGVLSVLILGIAALGVAIAVISRRPAGNGRPAAAEQASLVDREAFFTPNRKQGNEP